ncbi:MAG: hypothetical protein MR724_11080 [Prevotella sp.]|nr:hypothetical protein [Prevotella sp.]
MRKFYYLFLTMLLGMVGMSANAQEAKSMKVIFNVDNPDNVTINVDGVNQKLVAGDNEITLNAPYGYYSSVYVNATDGNFITEVMKDGANQVYNQYNTQWYYSPLDADADKTISIKTIAGKDARTASCTVNVDDASKVRVRRSGSYSTVELQNGDNTVYYIPGYETMLMIEAATSGSILYKVTLNETELPYSNGYSANLSAEGGDKIDIKANFPEGLTYNVKFTYVDEFKAKGVVTCVTVNGTAIEDYDNTKGFDVPAGQSVVVSFDNVNYKIDAVKLNDNPVYVYSSYSFTPTADTEINIDAHKYGTVKATLNIDNKDNVTVYKGYSYQNDIITVNDGDNEIELSENNAVITIKANSGCFITSVTYGETVLSNQSEYTINPVTEGMEISVISGAIVRDKSFTLNIDDISAAQYGFNLTRTDRTNVENLATGENKVAFAENETHYQLAAYGSSVFGVFKKGVMINPSYQGGTSIEFDVADGDVFDAYVKTLPSTYNVKFTLGEGIESYQINEVSASYVGASNLWLNMGYTAIEGTSFDITITPSSGLNIDVKVGETTITADANGVFVIPVSGAATISITKSTGTGINTINASNADNAIYTLQGVKVNGKAAKGLYIKNGKKVVVK